MYFNKNKIKDIEAMIFAAGKGKRMRYMTKYQAKPLIKFNNTSVLETNIKKIVKTENKNLCFKDQINFPKYILQQTKITKQRQQNASTMQLLQNQNDGLW